MCTALRAVPQLNLAASKKILVLVMVMEMEMETEIEVVAFVKILDTLHVGAVNKKHVARQYCE